MHGYKWPINCTRTRTEETWANLTQPSSFQSCRQECLATLDDAPEPPPEKPEWRKILVTALIVSVLMLPADR